MRINVKSGGGARIFNKAIQSVLSFDSALGDRACRNSLKPKSMRVMDPTLENGNQVEAIGANDIQTIAPDVHSFVENSYLTAIQEAHDMVAENPFDEWIKNNRLMALKQLESPDLCSSSTSFSSPYSSDSNAEMPLLTEYYSSDDQVSSESPEHSVSYKVSSLEVGSVSNQNYGPERPIEHQQNFSQKRGFSKNQKASQVSPKFHREVNSIRKSDEKIQFVCKSTNQKLSAVKESQSNITNVNNSESRNCCEPIVKNENIVSRLPSYDFASLMTLKSSTGFFDSHCHIDLLFNDSNFKGTYADYMAQHKASYPESYNGCIAVFCKPWTFAKEHMWRKHLEQNNVWGAFGCHPKQAKYYNSSVERHLEFALNHPKVRALGEIGLDYSKKNKDTKVEQHFIFRRQLKIAQKRNLRVVIHCREADDDAIEIMQEILPKDAVFHLHCFTGSWEKAQKWIEAFPNVFIGITNLVTFPSAVETHEVAKRLPLNRLLLETDAPFFVPKKAPKGTKYSHPGMAIHVAAQIAAIKNIPVDNVLRATCANTRYVYNIS